MIDTLVEEHQLILRALKVFSRISDQMIETNELNQSDCYKIIDFLKLYADQYHHAKEENMLFSWLNEKGLPYESGPIRCMLDEHETGRQFVENIKALLGSKAGSSSIGTISNEIRNLIRHLEDHISKENNVLYPTALELANEQSRLHLNKIYKEKYNESEMKKINQQYEEAVSSLEGKYHL